MEIFDNTLLQKKISKKFYGHKCLYAKYTPQVPAQAEREYIRLTNQYVSVVKKELERVLPEVKKEYSKTLKDEDRFRNDSIDSLLLVISNAFNGIYNAVQEQIIKFRLDERIKRMAYLNRKLTVQEWKKSVRATLGVAIQEDAFLGEMYEEMMDEWVKRNVDLIKNIPTACIDRMREEILDYYGKGKRSGDMAKRLSDIYGMSQRRANLIARDQTAKLNCQIARDQQRNAGIRRFKWSTTGDERVRETHAELDGQIFEWDDPPIVDGIPLLPGEDYQCRCIARPIFELGSIYLPLEEE